MQLFRNAVLVTNRQPIAFKCRACGACCKNVRDSIVLEPLDAYRIVRDKQKSGCTDSADDILWNMAELKELSPGFHVFVLRTVNGSGICGMLRDDRVRSIPCARTPADCTRLLRSLARRSIVSSGICVRSSPTTLAQAPLLHGNGKEKICLMRMRPSGLMNAVYCRSSVSCCEVCRKTIFSVPNSLLWHIAIWPTTLINRFCRSTGTICYF